jgi:hypothetical protein
MSQRFATIRPNRLPIQPALLMAAILFTAANAREAVAAGSVQIPPLHGTTFADVRVDLPEALHGKVGVFVVGFSQGSRDAVTQWGKKLAADFYDSPTVAYYEMPVLASVPKLLRGFVAGRIKSSVSDRGRPHFLPINENESAWRGLVHYADPDAPYIVVVDERGTVRWQTQGAATEATYNALKQQIEALRPH